MSFASLAVVGLAALLGPLFALSERRRIPVLVGELLAGVLLGPTLAGSLRPSDQTFTLLADVGFALVMFVAGSHVPVRDPRLSAGLRTGGARACLVGAVSVLPAFPPTPDGPRSAHSRWSGPRPRSTWC
jgi:Kef-type K+ transport system membrane component KefB